MQIKRLTDRGLKALKATGKRYEVATGDNYPGLFLRVSTNGDVSFLFRYQLHGRRRKIVIGNYPAQKLTDLLTKYLDLSQKVKNGTDPLEAKQKESYNPSIKDFSTEYLQNCKSRDLSPQTIKEYERIFNQYIFKKWGSIPTLGSIKVSELRRREISLLVNYIATKMPNTYRGTVTMGAPTQANRVLAVISGLCKFAVENELLEFNPALGVRKPGKVKTKDRYLSMDEIKITHDIIKKSGKRMIFDAFMLALLTGQRLSQIASLRLDYVKDGLIEFPAKKMKGGKKHEIYLSYQTKEIIEQRITDGLTTDYVFPGVKNNSHVHPDSLKRALSRLQPLMEDVKVPKFSFHDLRRTIATHLNRLGYKGIDRAILGHSATGITDIHYNRYDLAGEIKSALTSWGETVERTINGNEAVVISIK